MRETNENIQTAVTPGQMRQQTAEQETEIDLVELFYMYLGHIWQIALLFVLGAVVALLYTKILVTPQYTATAKIYVVSASNDSVVNLSDLQIGAQLTGDYEELLKIHPLLEEVIANLQLNMNYNQLLSSISISSPQNTRLLNVTVRNPSATQAAAIANEIAELAIQYLPEIMECAPPNMADRAIVPNSPSSPSTFRNTILGGMAAAIVYCGILLVIFMMDDTFKSQEDIERYLGETPLCVIPETEAQKNYAKAKASSGSHRR